MTTGNVILALFLLCAALAIAGVVTEGPPIMGGIDVIAERISAVPPITPRQ